MRSNILERPSGQHLKVSMKSIDTPNHQVCRDLFSVLHGYVGLACAIITVIAIMGGLDGETKYVRGRD